MKKFLSMALASWLILTLCVPALAQDAGEKAITVTGSATVAVTSDTAVLEVGAVTRGAKVSDTQAENEQIIQAVLAALKEAGWDSKDIVTSNYSVYSEMPYQDPSSIRTAEPTYNVTNMLRITIRDLSKAGEVIDVASKAGANQIYSLTFSSSAAKKAYLEALTLAVEDAQAKAETLAKAAGLTLGAVQSATTMDYYGDPLSGADGKDMRSEAVSAPNIVGGDLSVGATVTVVYKTE